MRKYLFLVKMQILEKMQYITNVFLDLITQIVFMFIFLNLWKYIYADTDVLFGFTLNQIVWYVVIGEILYATIRPRVIEKDLTNEIRSGKIAYKLNKPFNYILFGMFKFFGDVIIKLVTFVFITILLGYAIIGPLETFQLLSIPFAIISFFLATVIFGLIYSLISLTAFWFEQNRSFFLIYNKFILLFGVLFPLSFLPEFIQPIAKYSPTTATMYAPIRMIVDFDISFFISMLPIQIAYVIITSLLCYLVYMKGVKNLNVNGG